MEDMSATSVGDLWNERITITEIPTPSPIFYGGFSKMTSTWFTWQTGPCADYEYEFALCLDRVGRREAMTACKIFDANFAECTRKEKTRRRYWAMQDERRRQKKPFMVAPEMDSIRMWWRKGD